MTAYCDFYEQESVSTDSGRLRPDMIVRLPNGREIVIDAKAPVDAYMSVVSAASEDERKKAIANYISNVRNHMNMLSSKAYWDQFARSPEIVVMYLPGESFFSAAIEHDHSTDRRRQRQEGRPGHPYHLHRPAQSHCLWLAAGTARQERPGDQQIGQGPVRALFSDA